IATAFNISAAEVHGVISFYPDFRSHPTGDHVLRICRAEACQSLGADALAAHAVRVLGCDVGATTADGRITLKPVYCLGLCGQSPAIMLDDQLHARVNPAGLDRLLAAAGAVEPATDGGDSCPPLPPICRAMGRRWRSVRMPLLKASSDKLRPGVSHCAWRATVRGGCCGWKPWWKSARSRGG